MCGKKPESKGLYLPLDVFFPILTNGQDSWVVTQKKKKI